MTSSRFEWNTVQPEIGAAMVALSGAVKKAAADVGIDELLLHLIDIRASQLNGCAFCLDMHTREARKAGATDNHLLAVTTWQESPRFSAQERAVLALAEAVTTLGEGYVSDEVYAQAKAEFADDQVAVLIWRATVINSWNRIVLGSRTRIPASHLKD
ncbi:carboxymuconolactone decarboxylase family protein [Pseudonocardiaceae bacterium YIM PH 21723]|nr:carboxymuconolactone decarboxylase family protein [Pseudonocardiaceae bacterium YIM PH 21723]